MQAIQREGRGANVYLRPEGSGAGGAALDSSLESRLQSIRRGSDGKNANPDTPDLAAHHASKVQVRLVPTKAEFEAKFGKSPPLLTEVLAMEQPA